MIREYHRPKTLESALALLKREDILTLPLAGGTTLTLEREDVIEVVDLQALGLDGVEVQGEMLMVGAMVTLHAFSQVSQLPSDLRAAVERQDTYNLRQQATIGGCLAAADSHSPLAVALLALDTQVKIVAPEQQVPFGELLAKKNELLKGRLITGALVPFKVDFAFEAVSRTPADRPLVMAALARWRTGRLRLALGGWGKTPSLVLDGKGAEGIELAARSAYSQAEDEWASAEYRSEMAALLAQRAYQRLWK
ncbi:MAG: FAD binding domain-containing protein [Chloroflexota bacterium]